MFWKVADSDSSGQEASRNLQVIGELVRSVRLGNVLEGGLDGIGVGGRCPEIYEK